ncbi:nucleotidyl transferase AbiEii/AbiGii toxin family protein [Dickeya dianthicola]|uniref:Nucleotidyl transferase AbiEii/AbiGii toxin family protein n=2 Tax=Dickeya dianthicola TaxID=204039 RepID=A0AAX1C540_9GAMM|nr:nucleotidyl transferase AbiEii/AbiGii toxin family protein [Dickeya dianthicola]MCA7003448.1 nucleotidyl transferase AbiEii/AbiGii toxin family protein [Dickeya dianthicola]MCI4004995.1 nucleotidyl transferase AbiEii/AbiGii toxin family protein [Dickeya dianthicola]MCI4029758.1 nucleotidyl transferase AbiEii/AbiGii toxin family protein [Dickeya dianthicola]MCI4153041.1 nucleotidyl transferase AbiEii/AbiGii toxin family protein [Dickeya dianthicola]MCI4173207.1 nucleotidyl transferase AbiEii
MSEYKLTHHKIIRSVLENFNADFFIENSIFFGGGTRIALEINEYRESIDIDFLCPNKAAYRAVREQVTSASLGSLVKKEFIYARDIGFDRYAVRTFIREQDTNIKLEIVSFDNYELVGDPRALFPVPCIDRETCFYTKLLANSDRCLQGQCKDIFDILAMYDAWGAIPRDAFRKAEEHYGSSILSDLTRSLNDICNNDEKYYKFADAMLIQKDFASKLIKTTTQELLSRI